MPPVTVSQSPVTSHHVTSPQPRGCHRQGQDHGSAGGGRSTHQPRSLVSNWRLQCPQSRRGLCSINRYPGLRPCPGWQCPAQWNCSEEINNFLFYAVKRQRPFQAPLRPPQPHRHTQTRALSPQYPQLQCTAAQPPGPPDDAAMHRDADMGAWRTILVHQPLLWCGAGAVYLHVWSGQRVPSLESGESLRWQQVRRPGRGATADMLPRTQPAPPLLTVLSGVQAQHNTLM